MPDVLDPTLEPGYPEQELARDACKVLSRRELEVLIRIAVGKTGKETAAELGISSKTVDTHRGHLIKKLGLSGNVGVARLAILAGFVTAGSVEPLQPFLDALAGANGQAWRSDVAARGQL